MSGIGAPVIGVRTTALAGSGCGTGKGSAWTAWSGVSGFTADFVGGGTSTGREVGSSVQDGDLDEGVIGQARQRRGAVVQASQKYQTGGVREVLVEHRKVAPGGVVGDVPCRRGDTPGGLVGAEFSREVGDLLRPVKIPHRQRQGEQVGEGAGGGVVCQRGGDGLAVDQ